MLVAGARDTALCDSQTKSYISAVPRAGGPMTHRSATERQSLLSIQILRAFAAVAVTIEHIAGYEFARKYGLPNALPHFKFWSAGVDIFFVISGFVMVYASDGHFERRKAPREFFLRRLARIVPPLLARRTRIYQFLPNV